MLLRAAGLTAVSAAMTLHGSLTVVFLLVQDSLSLRCILGVLTHIVYCEGDGLDANHTNASAHRSTS